jgi:hypothetical protein
MMISLAFVTPGLAISIRSLKISTIGPAPDTNKSWGISVLSVKKIIGTKRAIPQGKDRALHVVQITLQIIAAILKTMKLIFSG